MISCAVEPIVEVLVRPCESRSQIVIRNLNDMRSHSHIHSGIYLKRSCVG